jgi:hypothetical protein
MRDAFPGRPSPEWCEVDTAGAADDATLVVVSVDAEGVRRVDFIFHPRALPSFSLSTDI